MAIYNGYNLASQGRNSTLDYYTNLNRPNPVGDQLGNNTYNLSAPAGTGTTPPPITTNPNPAPPLGGSPTGVTPGASNYGINKGITGTGTPTPTTTAQLNAQAAWRNRMPNANSQAQGTNPNFDPNMPEYLRNQYRQVSSGSEGGEGIPVWNVPGTSLVDSQGREVFLLNDDGSPVDSSNRDLNPDFDFKTMGRYDPDLGWVTDMSNTNQNKWDASQRRNRIMSALIVAGMGVGGALAPAAAGAIPAAEAGGVYAGMTGTEAGLFAGWTPEAAAAAGTGTAGVGTAAPGSWSSASGLPAPTSGLGPVTGPVAYEGAGIGATALGTGSTLPFGLTGKDLATAGSGLYNLANSGTARTNANNAADRADPFGRYRAQAGDDLMKLMSDPSYLYDRPGYKARIEQGEKGINRAAAGKGYFRSPNMLYDLSKYNSNQAAQEFQAEYDRLAKMAGVSVDPATAAKLQAEGAAASTNMKTAGYTQLAGTFLDWYLRS